MSSSHEAHSELGSGGNAADIDSRPNSGNSLGAPNSSHSPSLSPDASKEEGLFSGSGSSVGSYSRKSTTKEKMKQAFTGILLTSSMSVLARKSKSAITKVSNAEHSSAVLTHRLYSYGKEGGGPGSPRKLKPIGNSAGPYQVSNELFNTR
jgi:hypothetical protein